MSVPTDLAGWLGQLRDQIAEISPLQAWQRQALGALLLDVREDEERASGMPLGAAGLSRGFLELEIERLEADRQREIILLCASGRRSLFAAETLQRMGYQQVASVLGGFNRWKTDGLPLGHALLSADARQRYARQLRLEQVGEAGQARLGASSIALLGVGGLGSPAALYLAAAGVGRLSLIDDDVVERSNLHRQVLHTEARVGMAKTESARASLLALNPSIQVDIHTTRLQAGNVDALIAGHDVVIDGTDNFPVRYLLAAATRQLGIPLVYGAVERFSGQVSVFDPRRDDSPCYRCLFPDPPPPEAAPNCSEAGVLGVLPGLVGLLQATEALKLVLQIGEPLTGRLLSLDALTMQFRSTRLPRDPECPGCGIGAQFGGYRDLAVSCRSE
ncbi:molybdopterin-synthase adenylyltransferase MoeB [Frateuria aurantia]